MASNNSGQAEARNWFVLESRPQRAAFDIESLCPARVSRFKEEVRSGRLVCLEGNLQKRKDKDGRSWYFLVVQDKPHLAAMEHMVVPVPTGACVMLPIGCDPVAYMEFDFLVCGFVYFFKKKENRDALFKFLNVDPADAS